MQSKPKDPSLHPLCCGSEVKVPTDLRWLTGSFKRTLNAAPVVHLIEVPNSKVDLMPPSRISDLRLNPDKTGRELVAYWTAPGDNFDEGIVSQYDFIFSEDITDLLDSSKEPPILKNVKGLVMAGSEANFSFTFTNLKYDNDYHVAMYGIDKSGNKGKISNIVLINLPEPPTTNDPNDPTEKPPGPNDTDWVMVGVVSGVVLTLLILLLVGVYIYFFAVRRQTNHHKSKSNSGVNVDLPATNGSAASDNSSFDDAKNSSSNQLVPQISTISSVYKTVANGNSNSNNGNTNSNSFANGITPTYWSASQLLKEHEERKMRENAAKMSSIAEENAGYDFHSEPGYTGYNGYTQYDYPPQNDLYHHQYMFNPYNAGQRLSTTDSYYQSGGVDYNPNMDSSDPTNEVYHRNNNKSAAPPKTSGNSDNSSSGTLGMANTSLQGSLLSVNSGRPPSSAAKTRNITQV